MKDFQLFALRSNETNMDNARDLSDEKDLIINPGDEYYLQYRITGGNPSPDVSIVYDENDVTNKFKTERTRYLEEPTISPGAESGPAQKLILNDVNLTSINPLPVTQEMSYKNLVATAWVPSDPNTKRTITVRTILRCKLSSQ